MNKLSGLWINLKSSRWFVPSLIVIVCIALAVLLTEAGDRLTDGFPFSHLRSFGVGAEGSRAMLSAIAGSMITVAGLTFSLTIVAITQASSQYTSRVLRNFMRDRANQVVLGCFVGIFAYCLVVLRTIHGEGESRFVPSLAIFFGLLLAIFSIAVLIFFIHHIASSMQASTIISSAAEETLGVIDELFPTEVGEEADAEEEADLQGELTGKEWQAIPATKTGYIQAVDSDGLLDFAGKHNTVIRREAGVGQFVTADAPLVSVTADTDNKPALSRINTAAKINDLYTINHYRTVDQDAAFGIRQLVDIALKALSPGVNDTTTAIVCIDYLGAILARLARRRIEKPLRAESGEVQVIAHGPTFTSLVAEAFDQIRVNAEDNSAVLLRMLTAIETVARQTRNERRRGVLLQQVTLIGEAADRSLKTSYDRAHINERLKIALEALHTDADSYALSAHEKEVVL